MKKNKAFTLIEMLVVIAMIGLLSAVLLVALGPSRNKAKDSKIVSDIKQLVALGQTFYDPVSSSFNFSAFEASSEYNKLVSDISTQGGLNFTLSKASTSFAVHAQLLGGSYFCADSNGKVSSSTASNGVCQ